MTVIDGIAVAIWECDKCHSRELWLFKGDNGGYKATCEKCQAEDRELIKSLNLKYLWEMQEKEERKEDANGIHSRY